MSDDRGGPRKRASAGAWWAELLNGLGSRWLPFADGASDELPLGRLLRLGLFQVSVGMALAMLAGTLNRVMIVELGMAAAIVAGMLALPMLLAPLRPFIGFRSDEHRSALGWRRVPYLWFGTLLQFGGFAILPFALLLMTSARPGAETVGPLLSALAFLLVGAGAHTVQTAGLALATDVSPEDKRPRVVALLYLMLLGGMLVSALVFSQLLQDFSERRLIEVIQGAALVTVALNAVALWKQESRGNRGPRSEPTAFGEAWRDFLQGGRAGRLLVAVGLGAVGFSMQDALLEPYGGEVMAMGVGNTSLLTALTAAGAFVGFGVSARRLEGGMDATRLAALGALAGAGAFVFIVFAAPFQSAGLLRVGSVLIGFGGGLFLVGTLTEAMELHAEGRSGLAMGAWGGVHATAAGLAILGGGVLRDVTTALAESGALGPGLTGPEAGYLLVYHLEILALFLAVGVLGPMVRRKVSPTRRFGLAELPG